MVVMAPGSTLTPDLLPPEILHGETPPNSADALLPIKEATVEFKKRHIRRALAVTGGNQTKAAELLGIQRSFLNRQMKELGLRED
jgi:Nif-specific regulatory protein